jgi:hypothetical protein
MKKILLTLNIFLMMLIPLMAFAAKNPSPREVNNREESMFAIEYKKIDRQKALEKFFEKYNSPLKESSKTFIEVADKYNIDYRLIPAISCMESTCGKFLLPNSYNPFGWGIYGNNAIYFESWDEGIRTVGEGLSKGYFAKGRDTVEEIAPIYTPPNHVNWKNGVSFFMNEIAKHE